MFPKIFLSNRHGGHVEREKIARLEQAEGELLSLKERAARAVKLLDERRGRNHWREGIEQMIKGEF